VRGAREVEHPELSLELGLHRVDPREDPALLERLRANLGTCVARAGEDQPSHVPELDRELSALVDEPGREADVLRRRHLQEAVAGRGGAVAPDYVVRGDAG